jgi:hypothetical protein
MVASTVRDTVGYLASTFRTNKRGSPFHLQGGTPRGDTLAPYVKELLQAFECQDPPPNRQRALTPEMLKDLQLLARGMGGTTAHTGDLVEGAFFFAMRGCEFVRVRKRGKTRPLTLGNISFRDERGMELSQTNPDLENKARFVTITFVDQKNGKKMDRRSQMSTDLPLCPVRAWARVCRRVRSTIPTADDKTLAFSIGRREEGVIEVDSERVIRLLRVTCRTFGPIRGYGFTEDELGSRSIRSGAAMAMFLKNHSVEKIMILGRWSSNAFMVYIRPQVLEWTNIMAKDMASAGNFRDLAQSQKRPKKPDSSVPGMFPRYYLGR